MSWVSYDGIFKCILACLALVSLLTEAGVLWDCSDHGIQLAQQVQASSSVQLAGIYAHEGNAYDAHGEQEMHSVGNETVARIVHFAQKWVLPYTFACWSDPSNFQCHCFKTKALEVYTVCLVTDWMSFRLSEGGVKVPSVSIGSTPTASKPTDTMKELTEIHPGNYLFYG